MNQQLTTREKERDLTQSFDDSTYTNRQFNNHTVFIYSIAIQKVGILINTYLRLLLAQVALVLVLQVLVKLALKELNIACTLYASCQVMNT